MSIPLDTRLALDPQICLKSDVDRAVLLTRPQPLADRDYFTRFLHPSEAVLLALMDGRRTLGEVGKLWAELTDRPQEAGMREVIKVVDFYEEQAREHAPILIEVDDKSRASIRQYDPIDFTLPVQRVNLTDRRLRKPYLVYYLPTLFCPQSCIYCYAKTCSTVEENLLSLERFREILTELSDIGVEVIQLSGGDPFAHRDIFRFLELILAAGMIPDIPTKLGLSYTHARRLGELGIEIVQVSLDSTEPDVLDRMVGVKNYHRRVLKVLENLRRAGLKVRVNCVLTPLNAGTVGPLIDHLGSLGNVIRIALTPYGRSLFCHRDELFIEREDIERVETQVAERAGRYPHMKIALGSGPLPEPRDEEQRRRRWQTRAFCSGNRDGFVILPDGQVTVCEELYDHPAYIIGDLKSQSVMEMWNSPRALALLHPDQTAIPEGPCRTCDAFAECNAGRGRCWRDVLKSYGWTKPYYPDPRCPLAPPGKRLG